MENAPPSKAEYRDRLLKMLNILEVKLPLPFSVRLVIRKLEEEHGYSDFRETPKRGRSFIIGICTGMESAQAEDTLMHEYAHCLSWFSTQEDHGPEWGVAFSRVYRAIIDE
jgi:predicted mannosyl-3-phosphoglycerate phosphatase (HAD superfamily)